jgi:two-component system, NarL family, nitrate/nitrite response regulator NarL
METIRILLIAESPGSTQDLLLAIRRRTGFRLLGPVPDESAALEFLSDAQADIIVVELDRLDGRGVSIVSEMRTRTQIRVMAATRHPAAPAVELALAAGACGVLAADRDPSSLVSALRRAVAGELVLPAEDGPVRVDQLRDAHPWRARRDLLITLTEREREVIEAILAGGTTTGIALELGISPTTVRTHVKNILRKLGVHSTIEAVGVAWRAGLAVDTRSA